MPDACACCNQLWTKTKWPEGCSCQALKPNFCDMEEECEPEIPRQLQVALLATTTSVRMRYCCSAIGTARTWL
eukprot:806697-Amphidinium_carterae.1